MGKWNMQACQRLKRVDSVRSVLLESLHSEVWVLWCNMTFSLPEISPSLHDLDFECAGFTQPYLVTDLRGNFGVCGITDLLGSEA
jgi:hypothetical protein